MNALVKQLPFRSAFLAKLNLIVRVARSKRKAAKRIGIPERQFRKWYSDTRIQSPVRRYAQAVDREYEIAWVRLEMRRLRRPQWTGRTQVTDAAPVSVATLP